MGVVTVQWSHHLLLKRKTLDEYQVFDNTISILLDGTYYHHSKKIHCTHCQTKQKEDTKGKKYTEYYHSAITPTIAHPKSNSLSEFILTLNILSFLIHTICLKHDDGYKELYELINNRKTFLII